jgi:hypothetical protein
MKSAIEEVTILPLISSIFFGFTGRGSARALPFLLFYDFEGCQCRAVADGCWQVQRVWVIQLQVAVFGHFGSTVILAKL